MLLCRPQAAPTRAFSWIPTCTLALIAPLMLFAQAQQPLTEAQKEFFENNIRPVFAQNCATCHNDSKAGGLRVMSREDLLKGGASGPAVVPGDPDKSSLIAKIRQTDPAKRMPLGGAALKDFEIANFVKWVQDGAAWPEVVSAADPAKFFEDKIRPVIAFQCWNCHSTSQMGGLRLDTREGMLKGGKTGPAVVPGDPEKSLLITAVRRTNPALMMPKGGTSIPESQIADLVKWVKDGAVWPEAQASKFSMTPAQRDLWSIQALRKSEPPKVKDAAWTLNDIDKFIVAKYDAEGLKPAPVANKRALLRRATYDLTGLPPTYAEVAAFEADKSPKAWEKVIDRLQASPRYGEKWARHWMDVVRYGEDDYNVSGKDRTERYNFAYTYRDWLIKSFNEDMPYDMFVRAQLAGDMMDEKVRDKAVAGLGMNGLGVWHMTNMAPQIERADDWFDKVDVTTKAFLGLTVGCARCHDHKYDGIPTKDFYRLAGVFASSPYKAYPLVDKSAAEAYDKKQKELEEKEKALKEFTEKATELESSLLFMQTESYMVGAWRVGAEKKATVESVANQYKLDSELLQRWVRFLKKPPLNYSYLKNWQSMVERGGTLEEAKQLAREFYQLADAIDKEKAKIKQENETLLAKITDPNAKEIFEPLPNDKKRTMKNFLLDLKGIAQEKGQLWTDLFDFELPDPSKVGDGADAFSFGKGTPPGLLKFTDYALAKRLPADWSAQLARMKEENEAFKKEMGEHYPFVYGLGELDQPVDLRVFVRGNPDVFGEEAPRAFLTLLSDGAAKPFTKGSGRLELADEILKQPLAARVIVNRVWAWLMGSGIVLTENNFGLAGTPPSNPELLDYLALHFRTEGMSIKKLQKDIMMSRTYQLSADTIEADAAKDGGNRFYWKANTRRLDAEGVWDYLLTASGKLDLAKLGGPSQELADGMTRRGVYGVSSRMFPNTFQLTFDFLTPTISVEQRYTTTIPQQGLFFLNSPMVHNQAAALAERISSESTEEGRVTKAFQIVFQRSPLPEELTASIEFMHRPELLQAQEKLKADAAAAQPAFKNVANVSTGESGSPEQPDKKAAAKMPQNSPLKSFCWALLSSTEFLYIN
jgi:mono/diheme cytochrome c family protein